MHRQTAPENTETTEPRDIGSRPKYRSTGRGRHNRPRAIARAETRRRFTPQQPLRLGSELVVPALSLAGLATCVIIKRPFLATLQQPMLP
jgi:hypothetical protein